MDVPLTWLLIRRTDSPCTCPSCRKAVGAGRPCPTCATRYHPECANELSECALPGCAGRLGDRRGKPSRCPKRSDPLQWLGVGLGVTALVLLVLIVIPSFMEPRKLTNETQAIAVLKGIEVAQALFRSQRLEDSKRYGTLQELDKVLADGARGGYLFEAGYSKTSWWATARPAVPGTTGDTYFATNREGLIIRRTDAPYEVTPEGLIPELEARK